MLKINGKVFRQAIRCGVVLFGVSGFLPMAYAQLCPAFYSGTGGAACLNNCNSSGAGKCQSPSDPIGWCKDICNYWS